MTTKLSRAELVSPLIKKNMCTYEISPGVRCKAKAVNENTVKRGTREFLDPKFCQMHQPGFESKRKCTCPQCAFHRLRDARK